MTDAQLIEYCRKMLIANLHQYADQDINIFSTIIDLKDRENKKLLLEHCKAVKDLLGRAIKLLEKEVE